MPPRETADAKAASVQEVTIVVVAVRNDERPEWDGASRVGTGTYARSRNATTARTRLTTTAAWYTRFIFDTRGARTEVPV